MRPSESLRRGEIIPGSRGSRVRPLPSETGQRGQHEGEGGEVSRGGGGCPDPGHAGEGPADIRGSDLSLFDETLIDQNV